MRYRYHDHDYTVNACILVCSLHDAISYFFGFLYVRTLISAYFYPRVALLYFLAYHFYLYSIPYGFFDVALIPWICLMLHSMIYTVIALEVPASSRGAVSIESPREVYTKLSWPEWTAGIPADWTLFMPLNSRYIPIHDREGPDMNVDGDGVTDDAHENENISNAPVEEDTVVAE